MKLILAVMLAGALNASALQLIDREREPALWADRLTGDTDAFTAVINNAFAKQFPAIAAQNHGDFVAVDDISALVLASSFVSPTNLYLRVIHFHMIAEPTESMVGMVIVNPANGGLELFLLSPITSAGNDERSADQ